MVNHTQLLSIKNATNEDILFPVNPYKKSAQTDSSQILI